MSILSEHGSTKPINDVDSSDQIQIFHQCPYYGNWLEIGIVYQSFQNSRQMLLG